MVLPFSPAFHDKIPSLSGESDQPSTYFFRHTFSLWELA